MRNDSGLLQDAQRSLTDKLAQLESGKGRSVVDAIRASQQAWEAYRDTPCSGMAGMKKFSCESLLTNDRLNELRHMY